MSQATQPKILIYLKSHCPYCVRAKELLRAKGVTFDEVNLDNKPEEYAELKNRTGMMTVPQIFIGEKLIGGYSDLAALEHEGQLDPLLKQS
jgi:glutaredoxin 3